MLAPAIVLGLAQGIGQGVATHYQTKKLAKAYQKQADKIRAAAKAYSGNSKNMAMRNEGDKQGRIAANLAGGISMPQGGSNSSMANAQGVINNNNITDAYNTGNQLGRDIKSTEYDSKYNKAVGDAANSLAKAKTDYAVGNATTQAITNGLSNAAGLLGSVGGLNSAGQLLTSATSNSPLSNIALGSGGSGANFNPGNLSANLGGGSNALTSISSLFKSDENLKEPADSSDKLPEADSEDALRQIESVEYKYKPETGLDQDKHVGITAQSLEGTAFEDAVITDPDTGIKSLDKQKLLESLMAGIAALQKELDERDIGKRFGRT